MISLLGRCVAPAELGEPILAGSGLIMVDNEPFVAATLLDRVVGDCSAERIAGFAAQQELVRIAAHIDQIGAPDDGFDVAVGLKATAARLV